MATEITFTANSTTGEYEAEIQPTKDTVLQINYGGAKKNNRIGIYRSVDGDNFANVCKIPCSESVFCVGLSGVVDGETILVTSVAQPSSAYYIA